MKNRFATRIAILALTVAMPITAHAGSGANAMKNSVNMQAAQQGALSAKASATALSDQVHIFAMAVSAFATENVRSVPWNEYETQTPVAYVPIDVYAGSNSALCGFTAGSGTPVPGFSGPVNLVTLAGAPTPPSGWTTPTKYLPPSWSPPFGGTLCAEIWLNKPIAKEYTEDTYYVPPQSAQTQTENMGTALGSFIYTSVGNLNGAPIGGSGAFWVPPGKSAMISPSGAGFTGSN